MNVEEILDEARRVGLAHISKEIASKTFKTRTHVVCELVEVYDLTLEDTRTVLGGDDFPGLEDVYNFFSDEQAKHSELPAVRSCWGWNRSKKK